MKRYKKLFEKKLKFSGVCDRIRQTQKGEDFWKDMMANKKEISEEEFLKNVDLKKLLDEDETWNDYKSTIEPPKFYKSGKTYFFQTSGFEFIWSEEI